MKKVFIVIILTIFVKLSYSQRTCSDPSCYFYKYTPTTASETQGNAYIIPFPKQGYSIAMGTKMLLINQYYSKSNDITFYIAKDGYWEQIIKIHLCDNCLSSSSQWKDLYFKNGYRYAFSKDAKNIKPQELHLFESNKIDSNKKWKVE